MSKPRVLVVYYSRSGVTARMARSLAARLGADVEEIVDRSDRSGSAGFVRSLIDALLERPVKVNAVKHDPSAYELVVIATPVWAHRLAAPMNTWLKAYGPALHSSAFLCTLGGRGAELALEQMVKICDRRPVAHCKIDSQDIQRGIDPLLLYVFAEELTRKLKHIGELEWMV
ncbi:Flavodoxin [Burkholderia sp. D7]|nr:Flavodoxin [Burkholderia sp. D7]